MTTIQVTASTLGPAWYPIALAFSAWLTAWLGGTLYLRAERGADR
jgi:hypothetical protein